VGVFFIKQDKIFLFFGDLEDAARPHQQAESPDKVCAYLLSLFWTHYQASVLFSRSFKLPYTAGKDQTPQKSQ